METILSDREAISIEPSGRYAVPIIKHWLMKPFYSPWIAVAIAAVGTTIMLTAEKTSTVYPIESQEQIVQVQETIDQVSFETLELAELDPLIERVEHRMDYLCALPAPVEQVVDETECGYQVEESFAETICKITSCGGGCVEHVTVEAVELESNCPAGIAGCGVYVCCSHFPFYFDKVQGWVETAEIYTEPEFRIEEVVEEQITYTLYPNPTVDFATVELSKADDYDYYVYALTGQMTDNGQFSGDRVNIEFHDQERGVYLVMVYHDDQLVDSSKLIVQ